MARFISKFKKSTSSKGQPPKKTFELTQSSDKFFGYEIKKNHTAGTYADIRDHTPLIKALVKLVGFVVIGSQAPGFVRNLMKGDGNPTDIKGDGKCTDILKCTDIIESLKKVGENPVDFTGLISNSGCKWSVNDKNNGAENGNKKGGNERKITTPKTTQSNKDRSLKRLALHWEGCPRPSS